IPLGCAGVVDFTTLDVWTKRGLVTCYLLFVMELATRRVHFAGCATHPDEGWVLQVARNLTDAKDGFLRGRKYLLMDCLRGEHAHRQNNLTL
ncbi:MAG: hypothetical protein ABIG68_06405, partial [Acidobacteriota bacterium]